MWKQFYELVLRGARLTEDTAENKAAIKQLQLQVEDLTDKVQLLAAELRRTSENEAHERRNLALQLENQLLRFERRLPSGGKARD
jgi:uncharacterized protein YoxC